MDAIASGVVPGDSDAAQIAIANTRRRAMAARVVPLMVGILMWGLLIEVR